jgi:hypothetical protein
MSKEILEFIKAKAHHLPIEDQHWLAAAFAAAPTPPARSSTTLPPTVLYALRFYANGEHFYIDDDAQEFDTVSGEPVNWLHSEKDNDCTMIEDGGLAKAVLQGMQILIDDDDKSTPVEGEIYSSIPPAQGGRCSLHGALAEDGGCDVCLDRGIWELPPAQEVDANVCTSTSPDAHKTGNIDDKQEINYALISKHRELGWTVSDSVCKAHIAQVLPLQKQPEVTVTTTAQEAEPYAYAYKSSSDPRPSVYFEKMDFFPPSIQEIPLYTHPANDELRQAAEELIRTFDRIKCLESRYGPCPVVENLSAAMEGKS